MNYRQILSMVCAGLIIAGCQASADTDSIERGRDLTARFYAGDIGEVWQRMSPVMQTALGSEQDLRGFFDQVSAQLGGEVAVVDESIETISGIRVYLRTARFEKLKQLFVVQWAFDDNDMVSGFYVRPLQTEAPSDYQQYKTKTDLRLPFADEWFVFWGGRSIEQNYHAAVEDQRFAYDILIVKNGKSYAGDGRNNEDYHCFGRPVLAPGSGVIASTNNVVADNVPGQLNPAQALGNHVIIDHENGEYSFLAHFKKGTVRVKEGQRVTAGELLGQCGNSGNSSEPHIHYHLQDTPVFNAGQGLPAQFQNYEADGKRVERGEPIKGQAIAPVTRK